MQVLTPRQAVEMVTPPLVSEGSPVSGVSAGDSSSGFWGDLSLSPGGVQAVDSLLSRQQHPSKVETCYESLLSRPLCHLKVDIVKNQFP